MDLSKRSEPAAQIKVIFAKIIYFNISNIKRHINTAILDIIRLNAGWSVNTSKRTHKKDIQLTDTELLEIQKVLQRSEALERNERERVL